MAELIKDIWNSFRQLPAWVQIWVALILVPANTISLFFITQDNGLWLAFLTNIGMLLNLPVLACSRGFSNLMAFPHLVPWTILVGWLVFAPPQASGAFDFYLWVILIINTISLAFDYRDAIKWLRGERDVAGR